MLGRRSGGCSVSGMERPRVLLLLLLGLHCLLVSCAAAAGPSSGCSPDKLAVYQLEVRTFWTRDRFPKHYPDWRPPAQWSKTIANVISPVYRQQL
ncbi:hypothetical protein B566_EDAN004224 [Ephemera danica]|nr:hypothetical protein B566_EDAN004224 [Ephemera danica]